MSHDGAIDWLAVFIAIGAATFVLIRLRVSVPDEEMLFDVGLSIAVIVVALLVLAQ